MLLANTYLQKSHVILYPLLELTHTAEFKPVETYVSSPINDTSDCVLVCIYKTENTQSFYDFRNNVLNQHPLFISGVVTLDKNIIRFNLKDQFKEDFLVFLQGKYSKLSEKAKGLIKKHYQETEMGKLVIDTHLDPEAYHKHYADYFNVPIELIQNNFETLTPPDLELEQLK
jgi:hypothetical protein